MVFPNSFVTFNADKVTSLCSKFTIKIASCYLQFFIF